MKNIPQHPDFPVSETIYRRLLRAYPKAHRANYGAAMAQLFRDQCRDAWHDSGNWGLLKLWLRVLPDLASTSILERLAAMKGKKTMNDKLANLFGFRTVPAMIFFRVFVAVFLLVLVTSVVITFIMPEGYASTARIKVDSGYDPYFLQTTFEIIESQVILDPVIEKLKLNEKWGKKYNNGVTLKSTDTLQILQHRLALKPVRNTALISITVYSEDRNEAAQIANAVAGSYGDYRVQNQSNPSEASTESYRNQKMQIIDTAKPGMKPARPNKPLNIAFGAGMGFLLALIIGGISALVVLLIRKRTSNIPSAA